MNTRSPEIVVVGAGPAGVTAARTLLERGARVRLIDAGRGPVFPSGFGNDDPDEAARPDSDRDSLSAFVAARSTADPDVSPKFATAMARRVGTGFAKANRIRPENFHLFGALAGGGLSTLWGGVTAPYDDDDLAAFPFDQAALRRSYETVAARIGINGTTSDVFPSLPPDLPLLPPLDLHPTAALLAARYAAHREKLVAGGVRIGQPMQAVLTEDRGDRRACDYRGTCLTGCAKGAIYSAAYDLGALRGTEGFVYSPGVLVEHLERAGDRWKISTRTGPIEADIVVLAAGTIASTRLVLGTGVTAAKRVRILHNPVFAQGFLVPSRLTAAPTEAAYAMAQLSLRVELDEPRARNAFGLVYSTHGLPASDLAAHIPFGTATSVRLLSAIREALVPVTCFLPGDLSRSTAELTQRGLEIVGGFDPDIDRIAGIVRGKIARAMRRLGAFALPGAGKLTRPGADLHYAGTLPMGAATDETCRVIGADGLYVVDGSVFPQLPARSYTFTIMAIADHAMRRLPLGG